MISKEQIILLVEPKLEELNLFLVEVKITATNSITVVLDSDNSVTVDSCIAVSRFIEENLDRESEDFELDVMSAGVGQPLRIYRQYVKNVGRNVEVLTNDGIKYKAQLTSANETEVVLNFSEKVVVEGKKRKQEVQREVKLPYTQIKTAKVVVSFK